MTHTTLLIHALAGSGKDTVADYLASDFSFKKMMFANQIKEIVIQVFGFPREHVYGPSHLREIGDPRYPFSGTCPWCHNPCYRSAEGAEDDAKYWQCMECSQRLLQKVFYPKYVTPRLALTTLGTEWGRTLYNDIWASKTLRDAEMSERNIVITDMRYKNEFNLAKRKGAMFLRITRPGITPSTHSSETELLDIPDSEFDFVLRNDGSLDDLYEKLIVLIQQIRHGSTDPRPLIL